MSNKQSIRSTAYYGWVIWGLASIFYCYEYLLRITPNVMHTEIVSYYGLSAAGFGNLFAFYYYAYTPLQIPVGVLLDRYSPRLLLTLNCLLCAIGIYICSIAHVLWVAQLGRFLVGFGSAFAFVGILKLATLWLPSNRFALVAGLTTTIGMLGAMFSENVLTYFVIHIGPRETLMYSAYFGIILAGVIWLFVRNKPPGTGEYHNRFTTTNFKSLFMGMILLLLRPQIWICAIIGGILYTSLSVFAELWGKPYLQDACHLSPEKAAFVVSMVFFGWAIGGPLQGWISDRINNRRVPLIIGSIIGAISFMLVLYTDSLPVPIIAVLLFLFGAAASAENVAFAFAKETCEKKLSGSALALTNMFVMLVGTILQPLVGSVLDMVSPDGALVHTATEYRMALSVIPVIFIVAAVLGFFLKAIPHKIHVHHHHR